MSAAPHSHRVLPRAPDALRVPALACGGLLAATLVFAAWSSFTRSPHGAAAEFSTATAAVVREVRFEDRAGSVVVLDARSGTQIAALARGEDGFVRATMRSLARDRKPLGVGADVPFRLSRDRDGRVTLDDPVTGRVVPLDAFGATNARAFARFLDADAGSTPALAAPPPAAPVTR